MSLTRRIRRSVLIAAMSISFLCSVAEQARGTARDEPECTLDRCERGAHLVADHRDELALHAIDFSLVRDVAEGAHRRPRPSLALSAKGL